MNVQDFQAFLRTLAHRSFHEEGLYYGDPTMEIHGALLCWMANLRALRQAVDDGCNLVVCHEAPFFGSGAAVPENDYTPFFHWEANRRRKELLDAHGIAVVQCHRTLDAFCVPHAFQDAIGLGEPSLTEDMAGYKAARLFDVEPTPVRELVEQWKQALGLGCVRAYVQDLDRRVQRLGLAWGGIGLHLNLGVVARLAELGAELMIGGETDEYAIEFCADSGVDMIELGHNVSEAIGMKEAARRFAERFPDMRFCCFMEPPLYSFV